VRGDIGNLHYDDKREQHSHTHCYHRNDNGDHLRQQLSDVVRVFVGHVHRDNQILFKTHVLQWLSERQRIVFGPVPGSSAILVGYSRTMRNLRLGFFNGRRWVQQ